MSYPNWQSLTYWASLGTKYACSCHGRDLWCLNRMQSLVFWCNPCTFCPPVLGVFITLKSTSWSIIKLRLVKIQTQAMCTCANVAFIRLKSLWSDIGTSLQTWMLNKVMHQALNQNKSSGLHRVVQFSRNNRSWRRKGASSCVVSKCHYCCTSPDIPPQLVQLLYTRRFILLLFCVCDSSDYVRIYVEQFCFASGMFAARRKTIDCLKCRNMLASGRHGQKG